MTGDDRLDYNIGPIRELLLAAYSAEAVRVL